MKVDDVDPHKCSVVVISNSGFSMQAFINDIGLCIDSCHLITVSRAIVNSILNVLRKIQHYWSFFIKCNTTNIHHLQNTYAKIWHL